MYAIEKTTNKGKIKFVRLCKFVVKQLKSKQKKKVNIVGTTGQPANKKVNVKRGKKNFKNFLTVIYNRLLRH